MRHLRRLAKGVLGIVMAAAFVGNILWIIHSEPVPQKVLAPEIRDTTRQMTLLFGGDWMQHKPQIEAARRDTTFDYSSTIRYLKPLFEGADWSIINFETTLTHQSNYTGYPLFRSPITLADALRDAGVDVALLANNHCCDGGKAGVKCTIEELTRCGIRHTGLFADSTDWARNRILYLEHDSLRVALCNFTYGTNGMPVPEGCRVHLIDTIAMAECIEAAQAEGVDALIATLHWGIEYARTPNRQQRQIADFLRRKGVQCIIGSHPHVIQPIEIDSLGGVVWSLGNLVSNQQKRYTDGGLLVRLTLEKQGSAPCRYHWEVIPCWVLRNGYQVLPASVADTLPLSSSERQRYLQFIHDTHQLLSEGNK